MNHPMKILIIVGTRSNFIKITQFERAFNQHPGRFEYTLIHTGQHYDANMSDVFFSQFGLKEPDVYLDVKGLNPGQQVGEIIIQLSRIMQENRPDLVMVVGDVNSTLAGAIAANKNGILLAHLESGLRSGDRSMPEEINRILTDSITDIFFVTEQSGLDHLQKELHREGKVFFVGNTMIDTLIAFDKEIQANPVLENLGLHPKGYCVMTMHRPQNVDSAEGLEKLLEIIKSIPTDLHIVFPIHPRTKQSLERHGFWHHLTDNPRVILTPPLDYLAFQKLICDALFVLTDSGGIQEETTYRKVPCLTFRPNTERPVTITEGTNELLPFDISTVKGKIEAIREGRNKTGVIPPLWDGKATERIVSHLLNIKEVATGQRI